MTDKLIITEPGGTEETLTASLREGRAEIEIFEPWAGEGVTTSILLSREKAIDLAIWLLAAFKRQ